MPVVGLPGARVVGAVACGFTYVAHGQPMRVAVFYIVLITINSATGMHVWMYKIGRRPNPDATPRIEKKSELRHRHMTTDSRLHLHRKLRQ